MSEQKASKKPYAGEIKSGTTDSILASLFRTILFDIGVTPTRFDMLLEKYIIKAHIPINNKEISNRRGALRKELMNTTMTWKVFIKGLVFINVWKFDISIRLYHGNNKITEHFKTISLESHSNLHQEPPDVNDAE